MCNCQSSNECNSQRGSVKKAYRVYVTCHSVKSKILHVVIVYIFKNFRLEHITLNKYFTRIDTLINV